MLILWLQDFYQGLAQTYATCHPAVRGHTAWSQEESEAWAGEALWHIPNNPFSVLSSVFYNDGRRSQILYLNESTNNTMSKCCAFKIPISTHIWLASHILSIKNKCSGMLLFITLIVIIASMCS